MTLPERFAVWESDDFETGVLHICSPLTLHYHYDEVNRIIPVLEPQTIPQPRVIHGRIREGHAPWTIQTGRLRVQIAHARESIIYYSITPLTVTPMILRTGDQIDEELPIVLIYGEYLYGRTRPAHAYTLAVPAPLRWGPYAEDYWMELLATYNLQGQGQDHILTPRARGGVRRRERFEGAGAGAGAGAAFEPRGVEPTPLTQPPQSLDKPSERIALALARDFQREGEVCPITQDVLREGEIAVTGCLCVFQAEALRSWISVRGGDATCPSCRKELVYRVVTVSGTN